MGLPSGNLLRRGVAADAAFCRFNAWRSTDPRPARFEERVVGRAVAFRDRGRPDAFTYNRVLPGGDDDLERVPRLAGWFHAADLPCGLEAPEPLLAPRTWRALEALGFRPVERVAFHRVDLPAPAAAVDPRVRRAGADDLDAVLDLMEAGFRPDPAPASVRAAYRDRQLDPAFPLFVLRDGDHDVALASIFVHAGLAWLGNAFTRPRWRGRGHQLTLLRHRLQAAAALGCDLALTDVTPGTVSQRNVVRAGLAPAYTTRRWSLAPARGAPGT